MVNVRIFVEGYNAPITNGVCFMHLPSSKTTLIQIIGRALRLHPMKKYAKIILPYSADDDALNINNFLRIIAKNDSRVRKSYEGKLLGGYIDIEEIDIEDENDDENNIGQYRYEMIFDSMGIIINSDENWDAKINQVKQYIEKYDKRPNRLDNDNKVLGRWVETQICNYKIKRYNMSNPIIYDKWTSFINEDKYKQYFLSCDDVWYDKLNQTKKYIDEHNKRPV